jgi:dipeptidyl aminopeptidase/acylaminoacyl peptidase
LAYLVPDDDIVAIVDSPPTPAVSVSPDGRRFLLVHYESHPPIALLARPYLRLAGVRIDPDRRCRQRTLRLVGLTVVDVATGGHRSIELPDGAAVSVPSWAPDSRRFVFTVDGDDGIEPWIGDADTATARPLAPGLVVSDVLTAGQLGGGAGPVRWSRDSSHLFALAVPSDAPPLPADVVEPHVQETAGKSSQMFTFQDLLTSAVDGDRFEALATTQVVRVDASTGEVTPFGSPGLVWSLTPSPDGHRLLVHLVERPFSFRVPYPYFPHRVEVWSASTGEVERVVASLPVADEVPRQGVVTGPRNVTWEETEDATLLWLEALDGGDPTTPAEHRDRVMRWPLDGDGPAEAFRTQHRCLGWWELDRPGELLVLEHDRDRRWRTTSRIDVRDPSSASIVFDLSANDSYGNPGVPLVERRADGRALVVSDGDAIFLRGNGATPEGNRPFLDRFDLSTGEKVRMHASPAGALEPVVALVGDDRRSVLVRRESPTEPPNFVVVSPDGERRWLTSFPDPHPQLTGATKRIRTHHRPDGVALSGVLHLPPGHDPAVHGRLPLVLWAYPLEYSDADTAGQVRGSDQGFTRLSALMPIWFLLRGYAVLMDATMPVIGDPETMNDTYIEQVTSAARAHIDALDDNGIIDRSRVVVAGHSYGGYMTANLLAHTDLFAAGIARSGAYNRTLTPFGFQSERRNFWEATAVYDAISPFRFADRMRTPLLLIHGAVDANPGTSTVQSERLFQALQGLGGVARLVLLPHESHGYLARESVLHVLAEQFSWAERWAPPGPLLVSDGLELADVEAGDGVGAPDAVDVAGVHAGDLPVGDPAL